MLIHRFLLMTSFLAITALSVGKVPRPASAPEPRLLYTVTAHYAAEAWLHGGDRFPQGAHLFIGIGANAKPLVPNFYSTADANVSFDATHILFAGKVNAEDKWQIWEIGSSGGDPVRISACEDDCVRPLYLPEDRFVYARRLHGTYVIEVATRDHSTQTLSSIPGNTLPNDVLRDGRILFAAGDPLGSDDAGDLYTVYTDGSGVESYRCEHGHHRMGGKQLSSGDIVFAEDGALARFTSARAHEVAIETPSGEYSGDVSEDRAEDWVVSVRKRAASPIELHRRTAAGAQALLAAIKDNDLVEPQFLSARAVPNRHPSGLHDWSGANLLCLNAYTSKLQIQPGSVARMRLYTRSSHGETVLLGDSPVEKDGSFFLHVPAEQPLQIELLDRSGATLEREHGWFWMKRGEQRECVGCHAGPARAPENAVPQVLLRSTDPVDMTKAVTPQQGAR